MGTRTTKLGTSAYAYIKFELNGRAKNSSTNRYARLRPSPLTSFSSEKQLSLYFWKQHHLFVKHKTLDNLYYKYKMITVSLFIF